MTILMAAVDAGESNLDEAEPKSSQSNLEPANACIPLAASTGPQNTQQQQGIGVPDEAQPTAQQGLQGEQQDTPSSTTLCGGQQPDPSSLYRLKVVGIPAGYSEEQLRSLFQLCGNVAEARIVHDKQSGRPVGYGYVSYFTKEAADLATSTFDDQLQLQGAANTLSVYYAKKQHDTTNDKESCPARNAKLYFCGTPSGLRRDSILALFSAFGRVRHLQVYSDSYGVLSSGTVTMYSTDEAIAAMNDLDGKVLQPGTAPLKVTWAQLSTLPRRTPPGSGPPPPMPRGFTVSYACVPTSVTPAEVAAAFERFGLVLQVVPFAHRREGPANSRGCGLVVMETEAAAMAAVEALSGVFSWPGAERPLLVQPFYGAERMGPNAMMDAPGGPHSMGPPAAGYGRGMPLGAGMRGGPPTNHNSAASAGHRGTASRVFAQHGGLGSSTSSSSGPRGSPTAAVVSAGVEAAEPPPPGCSPDAFKLVLTNLPGSYTHSDIFSLLQPYGSVVSLTHVPATDPAGDSSAVVWYASGAQGDAALAALSNTVLMAAEGSRQLQVKAFKGPPGRFGGNRGSMMQQQQHRHGAGGHKWHDSGSSHRQASPSMALYQQQQAHSGGFASAGQQLLGQHQQQQQPMLVADQLWLPGSGATSAGPPGLPSFGTAGGQMAALAAATAAMSTAPNAYSMQQLLYMLPQQQQQQLGGGSVFPGGMMLPGGGVSLSGNSTVDASLGQMQGHNESLLLASSVAATAGLLAPPAGGHYAGWLG